MKKALALIALAVAVLLLTLGLLFLIAAAERPSRILPAAILVALGAIPLAWGITTLRRQAEISPQALSAGALALARRLGGEVTAAQLQAEFRIPAQMAQETLDKLAAAGQARREERSSGTVYVIGGLQPSLVSRRCPYCGSSFPVKEALRQCPNCGAPLELAKN